MRKDYDVKIFIAILFFLCGCSDVKDGLKKEFYKSGELKSEYTYKGGEKLGKFTEFGLDGRLLVEGNIQKGIVRKTEYDYFIDGKIKGRVEYANQMRDGITKMYYLPGHFMLRRPIVRTNLKGFCANIPPMER